jgi:hypothetical protein
MLYALDATSLHVRMHLHLLWWAAIPAPPRTGADYRQAAVTAFLTWWGNGEFDDLHLRSGGSAALLHISH